MERYRTKTYVLYRYGTEHKVYIHCHPQQEWGIVCNDSKSVVLGRGNVQIEIDREEFERHWIKKDE